MTSARSEYFAGMRALSPILLGVIPFGLISGIAVVQTGIPPASGLVMSVLIFSGAALIVALQLISSGAPMLVVLFSALVVNLRFMIYSASLAPFLQKVNAGWKSLLAYLMSDQAYAASILHLTEVGPSSGVSHWFLFGAESLMWLAWQGSIAVGMFLGARLPASWSLEFTIPLTFLALMVPSIKDWPGLAAAVIAGGVALLAGGVPYKLGMILAALAGIAGGLLVERMRAWKSGS